MQRAFLGFLLLPTAACTTDDSPAISMELVQNGVVANEPPSQSLRVELTRPYGHTWSTSITARLNAIDLGDAQLYDGHAEMAFKVPEAPASASWQLRLDRIERGVSLEITEGSERFVVEVPDFNAPRTVTIHTPLDALHAEDWIEVDSGVPTDALGGGFDAKFGTVVGPSLCFTQWAAARSGTSILLQMPPTHEFTYCGAAPAPEAGSTRTVDLEVGLDRSFTPIARCDGPDLTCEPVAAPGVAVTVPATLVF